MGAWVPENLRHTLYSGSVNFLIFQTELYEHDEMQFQICPSTIGAIAEWLNEVIEACHDQPLVVLELHGPG